MLFKQTRMAAAPSGGLSFWSIAIFGNDRVIALVKALDAVAARLSYVPLDCANSNPYSKTALRGVSQQTVLLENKDTPEATNSIGPLAAASSPAAKSFLSAACCATAAAILQKVLHIISPIVVGNLLPRLDSP